MKTTLATLCAQLVLLTPLVSAQTPKLADATRQALISALNDERHAEALYQAAIDQFGRVRPFTNIIRAEQMHQQHLLPLFEKYGVAVPANGWATKEIKLPATLQEVCKQSVQAELDNVALYDRLLPTIKQDDIRAVFQRLRDASQLNHLPAFQRCAGIAPAVQAQPGMGGPGRGGKGFGRMQAGAQQGAGRGRGWRGGRGAGQQQRQGFRGGRGAGAQTGPGAGPGPGALGAACPLGMAPAATASLAGTALQSMAQLDRAYVPSLVLTAKGETEPAKRALAQLQRSWDALRVEQTESHPDWQRDLSSVTSTLADATHFAQLGQVSEAHEALEGIRYQMMSLRQREGTPYFLDALTVYHEAMEPIVILAKQTPPEALTAELLNRLKNELLPKAQHGMSIVESTPLDNAVFGLPKEKLTQAQALVGQQRETLDRLAAALDKRDKPAIIAAAAGLKPPFAKLFMLFGDFPKQ